MDQFPHSQRGRFIAFAIISSVLSSVGTLFKVQGVRHVPPLLAAAGGVLFAGLLALVLLALTRNLPSWSAIKQVRVPLLKTAFCRAVFSNMIFTVGLAYTTGVEAVFLTKMEPYLVIFWSWVLDKRRPSGNHLALLVVHVLGAILLSVGGRGFSGEVSWFGDLIVVSAVVTAALSYRYAPQVTKVLSPMQTACLGELIGGVLTLPIALLVSPLVFGPEQQLGWFYIGIHAVMFYILAMSFLYASLNGIEGWLSSALRATGPVIATPIAFLLFGESLTPIQIFGALVVLVTSALISRR
jgi:drug/metabolite transporter (DMT)-like permease